MGTIKSHLIEMGKNVIIDKNVIIGYGNEDLGKIIIGDNSIIRAGTIIYYGTKIGNNFKTGHNVIIRENNVVGDNIIVGSGSELAPGNSIGNYTTIHSQCFLENTALGEYNFIAPGVKFLDDRLPIDPNPENYKGAIVGDDSAIGGGSVILPHIHIGSKVLIGAGSVVTKNIPREQVWAGNPAKFIRNIKDIKKEHNLSYLPGTRTRYNMVEK